MRKYAPVLQTSALEFCYADSSIATFSDNEYLCERVAATRATHVGQASRWTYIRLD